MNRTFERPVNRLLMGPGPSNVPERVLEAMARPLLGHLDPDFLRIMDEIQAGLRSVFETSNPLTIPISGTGSAGMDASTLNFVEPGDAVLVGVHGVFGRRIADSARRAGAECTEVGAPFGEPLDDRALAQAAEKCRPRVLAVVHAETSTGVLQPLEPIREICDRFESLFLVDAVTSLGGHPVGVDARRIDICYSGTQKCLSCPPGLAPFTASARAVERMRRRTHPCRSWYLDLGMVEKYWGGERSYHHTAPINMNFALREALRIIQEEGLHQRWARHQLHHQALVRGVEALGLSLRVRPEYRLWSLTTVLVPEGVSEADVRSRLLSEFNLEVGAGLGELKGRVWRVGLMGENSRLENVLYFLHALEQCLRREGFRCGRDAGVEAASEFYGSRPSAVGRERV